MNFIKLISVLFFLFFLSNAFSAMVSVSIEPLQEISYAFEEIQFKITVFNNELIEVNDIRLKVSGENELKIYENQKLRDYRRFPPMTLKPESKQEKIVSFKTTQNIEKEFTVLVEYGISEKKFQTTTIAKIKKNEIEFNVIGNEFNLKKGERNFILIDLENKSNETIKNVLIKLNENELIEIKSNPIEFNKFIPNQKILNTPIEFIMLKEPIKETPLVVELHFSDEIGNRVLKKQIELTPKQDNLMFVLIISLILIILFVFFYFKSNPKKEIPVPVKEQKPIESLETTKQKIINQA